MFTSRLRLDGPHALIWRMLLAALVPASGWAQDSTPALIPGPDVAAAVRYFHEEHRASELYRQGRFAEAEPLLSHLVHGAPPDGHLWYLLARTRDHLGDNSGAVEAYRHSLEVGYRFGAFAAYRAAVLETELDHDSAALDWLERALTLRWEDRPGLATDTAFSDLRDSSRFRRLAATDRPANPGRVEGWRGDIRYLVEEAQRLHVGPGDPAHGPAFLGAAATLGRQVPEFSDDRMILEVGRVLALLNDGHTGVFGVQPPTPLELRNGVLPLHFREFSDGLFIDDALPAYRRWIGARVLAFGPKPTAFVLDTLAAYVHHDNGMTVKWLGHHHILPGITFLHAIGATVDRSIAELTLETPDGAAHQVRFPAGPHATAFERKLQAPPGVAPPLWLSDHETPYRLVPLPDCHALYFQFNLVRNAPEGPDLAAFADSLRGHLQRLGTQVLIVDVRHNNGGNNGLLAPLVRVLTWWQEADAGHRIYVLMGRNTFSAAQNFLGRVERMTDAVFVGEPSSSSPNFTGETTILLLPYSRVRGSISTRHWQESDPDDIRPYIVPDVPIGLSSRDWLAGKDPAMDAVVRLIDEPSAGRPKR